MRQVQSWASFALISGVRRCWMYTQPLPRRGEQGIAQNFNSKWLVSHVQKGDATWRKPRSSLDRGKGKLRNCCYRVATTKKSPVSSTWRAAPLKPISTVCFCVSVSLPASNGVSSQLYFTGGNCAYSRKLRQLDPQ